MATRADITPELCRQLLRYEPETGKLFWRERPTERFEPCKSRWGGEHPAEAMAKTWNARFSGVEALNCLTKFGYLSGRINSITFQAHRVIWAMVTNAWPVQAIDHIDGNKANNVLSNLRQADHLTNGRNTKLRADNNSGAMGVNWCARTGRWMASITVGQKHIWLGRHVELSDACAVRKSAEIKYGFHPNHGRHAALPRSS